MQCRAMSDVNERNLWNAINAFIHYFSLKKSFFFKEKLIYFSIKKNNYSLKKKHFSLKRNSE